MTLTDPGVTETPIRSLTGPSGARMSLTEHKVDYTDAELAELNDEFERLPASIRATRVATPGRGRRRIRTSR